VVFAFGENWRRFLGELDAAAITNAQRSLERMLGVASLTARAYLISDAGAGCSASPRDGSALESIPSTAIHSLVGCAQELRQRFFPRDAQWSVDQASVLDAAYLARLGLFDIVYSWGVLHHTRRALAGARRSRRSRSARRVIVRRDL